MFQYGSHPKVVHCFESYKRNDWSNQNCNPIKYFEEERVQNFQNIWSDDNFFLINLKICKHKDKDGHVHPLT